MSMPETVLTGDVVVGVDEDAGFVHPRDLLIGNGSFLARRCLRQQEAGANKWSNDGSHVYQMIFIATWVLRGSPKPRPGAELLLNVDVS